MTARLLGEVEVWQLGVDSAAVRCGEILEGCGASLRSSQGDGTEAWHTPDLIVSDPTPGSALERSGPMAAVPVVSVATAGGSSADEALRRQLGQPAIRELTAAHAALLGLALLRGSDAARAQVDGLEVAAHCVGGFAAQHLCARYSGADVSSDDGDRGTVVRCIDGYVAISAHSIEDQRNLATLTGQTVSNGRTAVDPSHLEKWCSGRSRSEVVEELQQWRVPATSVPDEHEASEAMHAVPGSREALFEVEESRQMRFRRYHAQPLPLADITVLDLGMVWAGPYAGSLLSALGARVIKIEGPRRPDGTRSGGRGACEGAFADLNAGKESLVVDLSTASGRALFLRIARHSDAVIENFSPRVMGNFGLTYDILSEVNPRLVMVSMPAFPTSGFSRDFVAYGSILELAAGLGSLDGDGKPAAAALPYLDYLAGVYGAIAVVARVLQRDRTGRGARVVVAQFAVAREVAHQRGNAAHAWELDVPRLLSSPDLQGRGLFGTSGTSCQHYARAPWSVEGWSADTGIRTAPVLGSGTARIASELGGASQGELVALGDAGVLTYGAPAR